VTRNRRSPPEHFKFERDQIAAIRETGKGFFVVERRSFADNIRTGIRFRRINMTMIPNAPLAQACAPTGRRQENPEVDPVSEWQIYHGGGFSVWTLAD
jgi:hypothetical protein